MTYDDHDRTLTPADVADQFEMSTETATARLDKLADCQLLARNGDDNGYRPTVTARELLKLDIDDDFVIVDTAGYE